MIGNKLSGSDVSQSVSQSVTEWVSRSASQSVGQSVACLALELVTSSRVDPLLADILQTQLTLRFELRT